MWTGERVSLGNTQCTMDNYFVAMRFHMTDHGGPKVTAVQCLPKFNNGLDLKAKHLLGAVLLMIMIFMFYLEQIVPKLRGVTKYHTISDLRNFEVNWITIQSISNVWSLHGRLDIGWTQIVSWQGAAGDKLWNESVSTKISSAGKTVLALEISTIDDIGRWCLTSDIKRVVK